MRSLVANVLAIDSIGVLSPVGVNAGQTMGSVMTGLQFHRELISKDPAGEPLVGALSQADVMLTGVERLVALATVALAECASSASRSRRPTPLLLCVPNEEELGDDARAVLERLAQTGVAEIDPAASRVFAGQHTSVADALLTAERLVASREHERCFVGGVDALCDLERLPRLVAQGRAKTSLSPGFIPGEAAVFLGVTAPRAKCVATIAAVETRPQTVGRRPADLAAVAKAVATASGTRLDSVSHLLHDVSGKRAAFRDLSVALTRMTLRSEPATQVTTAAPSTGELGAATGAFMLAQAAFMLDAGAWDGPDVLTLWRDDDGRSAAAIVRRSRIASKEGRVAHG